MPLSWTEKLPLGLDGLEENAAVRYGRDGDLVKGDREIRCCVRGCTRWLARRRRQQDDDTIFCPEHGISVSTSPTYIYKDYRQNFLVDVPLLQRVKKLKVESWRLGNERSEDALTWNVFVSLARMGCLNAALKVWIGFDGEDEPELFLWGIQTDSDEPQVWERLKQVRSSIEQGAGLPTEPDMMLRVPGRVLVFVEAKFGSSNGTLTGKSDRFGGVAEFLERYPPSDGRVDPLNRPWIEQQEPERVLEQLCRNVLFAQRLADQGEVPYVVNLLRGAEVENAEAENFEAHLIPSSPVQFRRATWEGIRQLPVMDSREAEPLRRYFDTKTNRLEKAFLAGTSNTWAE